MGHHHSSVSCVQSTDRSPSYQHSPPLKRRPERLRRRSRSYGMTGQVVGAFCSIYPNFMRPSWSLLDVKYSVMLCQLWTSPSDPGGQWPHPACGSPWECHAIGAAPWSETHQALMSSRLLNGYRASWLLAFVPPPQDLLGK